MLKQKFRIVWRMVFSVFPDIRGWVVKMYRLVQFFGELKRFRAAGGEVAITRLYPCLFDKDDTSGRVSTHYFHQDLYVAQRICAANPVRHVDVGSRLDGFVAHVASFRALTVLDIRPAPREIPNVTFAQCDLMQELDPSLKQCCDSLSCLHALEHFGLGRYGDPLRSDGHVVGLERLCDLLQPRGKLYLGVPIGPLRVEFNAHRVFSLAHILGLLGNRFSVDRFSYIDDAGVLHMAVELSDERVAGNCGCFYGCGIFELVKT